MLLRKVAKRKSAKWTGLSYRVSGKKVYPRNLKWNPQFLVHPSHFCTSSLQGWEKCLVKVSFKSTHFASFGRALKKCVKIAYFCTPEYSYGKFITCLVFIANKKSNARASNLLFQSSFEFAISHELWSRRDGVTPHHTAPMPRWSDCRQHFGHSAASWHCGVEWSPHSPDPSPLDFFLRIMLRLKRTHVREPLTVI